MRNVFFRILCSYFLIFTSVGWAQDDPYLLDFSGSTLAENQISAQGAGFGTFPQGTVEFGSIPTDNAFEGATDGQGAIITCQPGEGVMLIAPNVPSSGSLLARCSIRANASHGSIVIATVDQSSNTFVSTNTPNNGGYFLNQYRKLGVLSIPSPNQIMPILQVYNPSETEPLVVYLDNFEFYVLDMERAYNAEFLATDGANPDVISDNLDGQPTPSPTPTSTPTEVTINTPAPSPTPIISIPTIPVIPTGFPTINPTFFPTGFPTFPSLSTPTPQVPATPTQEPSGSAVGLRLTVCEAPGVASSAGYPGSDTPVSVIVDLIDSNGAIVNPGTEGGDLPRTVTVSVNGSAQLDSGGQSSQVTLDNPEGIDVLVSNNVAETVTITASAEGLNDAEPVQVDFVSSGSISGSMRIWDGAAYISPDAGFDVDVEVLQTTADVFSSYSFSIDTDGNYTISGLVPGTYTIRFTPLEQFSIPGLPGIPELPDFTLLAKRNHANSNVSPTQLLPVVESSELAWVCQSNLIVTANQVLDNVNIDFGPRQAGATVSGTITRVDENMVTNATVLLVPEGYYENEQDPNFSIDCNLKTFSTNLLNLFQDPEFDASFEFTGVPTGTYQLHVVEYPMDEESGTSLLTNGMGQTVVVGSANVSQDVVISPAGTISPISPVNYSRVSASPMFEIERSPEYLNQEVSVMLFDRCFNEVWSQDGVVSSEIQYTGPALSNQNMYYWFISPNEFNPFFFNLIFNEEGNVPIFLAE